MKLSKPPESVLLILLLFTFIGIQSCVRDDLEARPRYILEIPEVNFTTTYSTQGTASQRINTVWISINERPVGTFEIPAKIFFTADPGPANVRLVAGVSQNGINALRTPFPFFRTYQETILIKDDQETYYFRPDIDSLPLVNYIDNATIERIENFESTGFNLQTTSRSDVPLLRTTSAENHFNSNIPGEPNQFSGVARLQAGQNFFEVETTQAFVFPRGGAEVFAELHYNINHPLTVGLIARTPGDGSEQFSVVEIRPSNNEWRKIYIRLTDDVAGTFGATDYKLFLGGIRQDTTNTEELEFMIDNLKLLY